MENDKLATELLHEIKAASRRWFIAFIIVCVLEVLTIGGFIWYISLPVEETEVVTQESSDDTNTTMIGIGDYNGETDGDTD